MKPIKQLQREREELSRWHLNNMKLRQKLDRENIPAEHQEIICKIYAGIDS